MNKESRKCQNCHNDFRIDPEDFAFYEKIQVPLPTFCPDCRFQRRLMFWNPLTLFRRPCDLCHKFNISAYPTDAPYKVYCPKCWHSDEWDSFQYGRDYDFNRPFFEQLNELWHEVPLLGLSIDPMTLQDSPFNHDVGHSKNCYLIFNADYNEDCAYGYYIGHSKTMFDCAAVEQCQMGYDSMHSYRTNHCVGSRHQLSESVNCLFCRDCQNCQNCFASANLKNKKYWAWNKPLSKEDYFKEISQYDLGSYKIYKAIQAKAEAFWATQIPKSEYNEFVVNCTGPNVFFSKNVKDSIEVISDAEDCRYLYRMWGPVKDCYDITMWGNNLSLSYECGTVGENASRILFSHEGGINLSDVQYSKLSTGTFCPQCRMIRRMCIRNERVLYKRRCQAPGHNEEIISIYAPDKPFNIVDQKFWWSDEWDPLSYGRPYDFSKPFFRQFRELLERVPLLALSNSKAVNSDYCNVADQSKDSYLTSGSFKIEQTNYSNRVYTTKNISDVYVGFRCELCYECVSCSDCYMLFYSQDCNNCTDSYFLYDCKNCSHCIGCVDLRNQKYHIFNKPYSREDYEKKLPELRLHSRRGLVLVEKEFEALQLKAVHKYARIQRSLNSTGDNLDNVKNCHHAFDLTEGMEDGKYVHWGGLQTHDAYDAGPGVGDTAELVYECTDTGLQSSDIAFTNVVYGSQRVRYALYCHGSSDLFGCIGLRSKHYCILNKQYAKEEYEALLPKVVQHMNEMPYIDRKGRVYKYGEFFPMDVSPMAYNESIAQDYFPITREEALARGYVWHETEERTYAITMKSGALADTIETVDDNILQETIECADRGNCMHGCVGAFRIIQPELAFYRRLNIPLPQLCFNCRHARRLAKRNPMQLWHRKCQCGGQKSENGIYKNTAEHFHGAEHCPHEFETTYAPERKEIVYCEQCYNSEVA